MPRPIPVHPLVVAALATACLACSDSPVDVDPLGAWGGEGVALQVTVEGGNLEFDCAVGTIDEPIEGGGRSFTLDGTFTLGFGGPEMEGMEPDIHPAIWMGVIEGDVMTLSGRFGDDETPLGPYRLRKEAQPLLRKCL